MVRFFVLADLWFFVLVDLWFFGANLWSCDEQRVRLGILQVCRHGISGVVVDLG